MATPNTKVLKGSCQCGSIQVTSAVYPLSRSTCYCTSCRKYAGSAPYSAFYTFHTSDLVWTGGILAERKSDIATRGSCPACHSWLTFQNAATPDRLSIGIGIVDWVEDDSRLKVPHSIYFTGDKPNWRNAEEQPLNNFDAAYEANSPASDEAHEALRKAAAAPQPMATSATSLGNPDIVDIAEESAAA